MNFKYKIRISLLTIIGIWPFLIMAQSNTEEKLEKIYPSKILLNHYIKYGKYQDIEKLTHYPSRMPTSYYQPSPALFCRIEDQINNHNKLQCFFRLGSLDYVNYLEQKGVDSKILLQ